MSDKLSALTINTAPLGKDELYQIDNSTGTPASASVYLADLVARGTLSGMMVNGIISPTVSSNNLTVAIKALDGTDPSSTNPVIVRIGNSYRRITAALSVTLNAGTNWFASGGSAFAAREIDYFVYLGWRAASSAVVVGFARIPYANVYSQFSATTTAETHGAFSTAPASTDDVVLIGRFAATLSAAASYNWSVPTFTTNNLIQRPIFKTRNLTYLPTWASSGTQPAIGDGTILGMYQIDETRCKTSIRVVMGASTTYGTGTYTLSIPFTAAAVTNTINPGLSNVFDNSTTTAYTGIFNLGNVATSGTLFTHANAGVTATAPITLATSDTINVFNDYAISV